MTFISGTVIYTVITQRLAMNSLLTAVQRTIDNQNKSEIPNYFSLKENLYPLILYTLILCTIATVVFLMFRKWQNGLTALIILAAGYASRMTVSLSPTIYASGLRTYTPLILSFTIVSLLLLIEISGDIKKTAVVIV